MEKNEIFTPDFFKNLGKLFYAVAASDKKVETIEIQTLKDIIQSEWQTIPISNLKNIKEIENTFDALYKEGYENTEALFQEFIIYKNAETHVFTNRIKKRIIHTTNAIASSFSGRNKSELMMLAQLEIEFKKAN